jgi:phosphoribosylaminoimidazolecarboxamide formyltransferase / IMP cyclohydrolase
MKKITSALISVYYKDNLEEIVKLLYTQGVQLYSTGGTQKFIESLNIPVIAVENLTSYPAIFGGRVKTLHPAIFGGILYRRDNEEDKAQARQYDIHDIDLVIVDLYPFEETVAQTNDEAEIIEKIDIGGISLIRAAAKNYEDVLIVSSKNQYSNLLNLLQTKNGCSELADRKHFAMQAFATSSHYDTAIFSYFNQTYKEPYFKQSIDIGRTLRYGENPHQQATFYGDLAAMFEQLNGKELSYNNLVDVDAAVGLIDEFAEKAFAIIKHTNACGVATGKTVAEAYRKAFAADTVSAFGGVLISNATIDEEAADEMNSLFFEILIAPSYTEKALEVLKSKKNRMILRRTAVQVAQKQFKTLLNGVIEQDKDLKTETAEDLKVVTKLAPTKEQIDALLFAAKVCKHTKSNTIILANEGQLFASGVGQTSRVDALKQAIEKAANFGFKLQNAVMASDAFFPFPDCVEIANKVGIQAVIQPGGSVKDTDSIAYCDANNMTMVFTGIRHFKH